MKVEIVTINTPFIKLDALLKFSGAAQTGGHAKEMILDGLVLLNGAPCQMRGKKIVPGDRVAVAGQEFEVVAGEG